MEIREYLQVLVISFLLFVGGLLLFNSAKEAEYENKLRVEMRSWPKAEAKIESANVRYSKSSGTIYATYTYNYQGTSYTSSNVGLYESDTALSLFKEKLKHASTIPCFVNPTNPKEAYLFNQQTEDTWPTARRLGGVVLSILGAVIFYFTFLHRFFRKKKDEKKTPQQQTNTESIRKIPSYGSLGDLINLTKEYITIGQQLNIITTNRDKIEVIIWLYSISQTIIQNSLNEARKKQNEFTLNPIRIDYLKLRGINMACAVTIQKLNLSNLSLGEISKLYWNRFNVYSQTKKENYFITLFAILANQDEQDNAKCTKVTTKTLINLTQEKRDSLIAGCHRFVIKFFQKENYTEIYRYSTYAYDDHAHWRVGLKDQINGKVYTCCNSCGLLHEVVKLNDEMTCPACIAKLEKYFNDTMGSDVNIKWTVICKHCGTRYREHLIDISHHLLCYTCFNQLSTNFTYLKNSVPLYKN
ncbi:MAG: DUF3592 domain-containing protein [Akkermansia sp.]|nr:DUF3592 domain-containing protein [Akkermansia sp.]